MTKQNKETLQDAIGFIFVGIPVGVLIAIVISNVVLGF